MIEFTAAPVDLSPLLDHGARARDLVSPPRNAGGFVSAVVIRTFGEADDAPRVSRVLELACPPNAGSGSCFPTPPSRCVVDRVIQRPMEPAAWQPGFRRPAVDVLMAVECAAWLSAALGAGWKAV